MSPETNRLIEAEKLISRFIWQGGKLWKNHVIQKRVKWLFYQYGITRQEIIENLKWKFEQNNHHQRYYPAKSCLETYVLNFCYYGLLSMVRECKSQEGKGNLIPVPNHLYGLKIQSMGKSYEPYERDGIDGLVEMTTPEDLLIGKELLQMAEDHFGREDLEVLLGARDRKAEAERLGLTGEAYRLRLFRKRLLFKEVLKEAGYLT